MESILTISNENVRKIVLSPAKRPVNDASLAIVLTSVQANKEHTCKIDQIPVNEIDTEAGPNSEQKIIFGCLGLIKFKEEDFVCVITSILHIGTIHGRELFRIEKVDFISLSSSQFDRVNPNIPNDFGTDATNDLAREFPRNAIVGEHPCESLSLLLSDRTFYFSYDWDCTKSLQESVKVKEEFSWHNCEQSFFWNKYMLRPLLKYSKIIKPSQRTLLQNSGIFVICFEGFAEITDLSFGSEKCTFGLFSRLSCKRAGTRFRSRGIDDDGNVSNFVETETLFSHPDYVFSQIILRGSVPIFWNQQGFQLGFPRIQLTRTPAATQPSFDRHFNNLQESYGLVHIIDLLNQKEGQAEHVLSHAYDHHARKYPLVDMLSQTSFDVYSVCKNGNYERLDTLFHLIGRDLQIFGYFVMDSNGQAIKEQKGIFRINCLDCLDRTNIIQNYIVKRSLDLFVRNYLLKSGTSYDPLSFQDSLNRLWSDNGDQLSRIYTGSNAIKSSYGRLGKLTFSSFMEDVKNTARRFYSNNFTEKLRQQSIDMLLGKTSGQQPVQLYTPSPNILEKAVSARQREYCEEEVIILQVISWNTNSCLPAQDTDFSPLISAPKGSPVPHIICLGLQEIVSLNATQIMSADPERRILWEAHVVKLLNERYKHQFSSLASHQLVGTTLSIFVRSDYMDSIRNVEIASKKTGMGGMAGNKGSVAIKIEVSGTSVCFVASHFAAGQANTNERDRDMANALAELQMTGSRDVLANDTIFWCGDFNYRIDLDRDFALELIREKDFKKLKEYDQLRNRMNSGLVFTGFSEAEINFAPTYKYDQGTNVYDTSEKMRTPSWTDRILWKGDGIKCLSYDRAEIDLSDHKPVKALYEVITLKIDRQRELQIKSELAEELKIAQSEADLSDDDHISGAAASSFDLIELSDSLYNDSPPPLPPRPRTTTT